MTDDDLKKMQKLIKDEIRPVKETVEILKSKMGGFDLYQRSTSSTVRSIKEQQSVFNEKLDDMTVRMENMKTDLEEKMDQRITASEQKIIKEIGTFIEDRLLPQLDDKAETHVTDRLDNRIDHMADQVSSHEGRIKKLEGNSSITSPTV